jgi:hypothetical protein
MSTRRGFAGVVGLVVLIGGCGGSGSPAATPPAPAGTTTTLPVLPTLSPTAIPASPASATPLPTASAASTPTAPPAVQAFSLNADVWWSGYGIMVTGGTYDVLKHTLNIDAAFGNTSTEATELRSVSAGVKIAWNGQFLPGYVTSGTDPGGGTANAAIQIQVPAGFAVADAILTFGAPDQHQALVPLNGDTATSDLPSGIPVVGTVKMGKYVTYKITGAGLLPFSCLGYPGRISYGPLKSNVETLMLLGTASNTDPLNYAQIDRGSLQLPDSSLQTSNPPMSLSLPNKATLLDQDMCFAIPLTPGGGYATGPYTLSMHEYRSNKTGTVTFALP